MKIISTSIPMLSRHLLKATNSYVPLTNSRRTIKSAVVRAFGDGKIDVEDVKRKDPREGEVLVKVETASVNYSDILMMRGKHHLIPSLPFTPGFELAGNVISVGKNVKNWKEGDRILGLISSGTGAFAEECILHETKDLIIRLPYSISSELAVTIGVAYGSAYLGMKRLASLQRGNSFLILTSLGTIGLATCDIAQNIFEGEVFAASDSEEKLAYLRKTEVISTLNWTDGKLAKNISKKTFGKGVDFVIDTVGGEVFDQALECLKPGGHLVSLSFSSGKPPNLSLLELHKRNASVTGIWLGGREQKEIENELGMVLRMFDEGILHGLIKTNLYPLGEIKRSLRDMENPEFFGKAVLTNY